METSDRNARRDLAHFIGLSFLLVLSQIAFFQGMASDFKGATPEVGIAASLFTILASVNFVAVTARSIMRMATQWTWVIASWVAGVALFMFIVCIMDGSVDDSDMLIQP